MNNFTTRGLPGLVLCIMGLFGARGLPAQCPPDADYPFRFCKDGQIVTRCASDPYHLWEDGKQLVPFKRYYPACMTIERDGQLDIYMPKIVTGGTDDYVPVFLLANQERDIVDGFNDWNSICPPSDGDFDCCMKIYFSDDDRDFGGPNEGINGNFELDARTCRPTCNDDHRVYVNDSPLWLYKNRDPAPGNEVVRAFYTGRYPPSVAPGYEAFSLYQAVLFGVGFWYGLPDIRYSDPGCKRPNSVMANELVDGPPTGLTPDDICQFKKLYCDHEVGLGVDDAPAPSLSFDVAPNPAGGTVTLRLPEGHSRGLLTLRLVDARGATVRELQPGDAAGEFMVDVSDLPDGVYLITLSNGAFCHGEKVIVRH
ncbi:MAG TPA: T9SS type A sorting domain-containing protein [Candidatus Kapabacteria bacterium]|nr:T9SS type A sorting domain-containing protein [Candidatus Kapabacteria bacterium]